MDGLSQAWRGGVGGPGPRWRGVQSLRRLSGRCALLGLVFSGTALLQAQPLFPPQSTVVLLSGVPGDMESEAAFREQLLAWIEVARASSAVKRLCVLCDDPEPIRETVGTRGTVDQADRAHFLELGRSYSQATNALVCVVWGHGGKQGAVPVFHVRGPRLTGADFKTVAAQIPAATSRWVLLFRGSGSFGAQLAGEHRQILASEKETMFNSDPVGMPVLLKLVRAQPESSFAALSEAFGQGVQAWYQERNLARTEEPTLWSGAEPPRLLAATTAAEVPPVAATVTNRVAETNVAAPPLKELPAAWKQIQKVDPKQYPEADGVLLRRRLSYTLGANPAIAADSEQFIQILTAEGKRFGDFDISYSPPGEDIEFQDCEVRSPEGKLTRLDPEAIREARPESVGDYSTGRRKFFSLPGVVPGAVLHVRYQTRWKQFPMPYVSLEIPLAHELPALESIAEVSVPKETAFHFAWDQIAGVDPVVKQATYGTTYTWSFTNLSHHGHEALSPPRHEARLMVSTFPDWAAFGDWYGRISRLTGEVTPELAAKAKELTRQAGGERERLAALYNYVASLRYVAVPLGVNSFRPHAAANVLQNQFGDCKDKANLLNALLHALDIQAHLVLVPRFSQAYEELPGFAFNHAISRVLLGDQVLWLDTTDDVCRFGMLPPGDAGRKVLVIDGQSTNLMQLPSPVLAEHQLTLAGEVDCAGMRGSLTHPAGALRGEAGDSLPLNLRLTARGFPDYQLRTTARETKEHGGSLPLLAALYRPVAGGFALGKQGFGAVSALGEDFTWQAEGECVGLISAAGGASLLQAPFWLPNEWDLALHRRASELFLNHGYPLTLDERFKLSGLSAGNEELPAAAENKAGPLRWRLEWERIGDDELAAHLHAELIQGELSVPETVLFQQQLRALWAALARQTVRVVRP